MPADIRHTLEAHARSIPPVCLREKVAAVAVGVLVIQLPWFLGGINIPAQFANLALALAAFATLFIPLKDPLSPTPLDNLKNLLKFPVFWLGLVFLAYLLIQYFNPHIVFTRGEVNGARMWWVQPVSHITWLPSGLESPYYPMNALRFFVMWCTPILLMCVCKLAIRRRRTWYALLWVSVINACVISIIGLAVRYGDSNYLLWTVGPFPRESLHFPQTFFGPFVYANHAGMFLYLNMAAALGLFLHARKRAINGGDRSGRYWLMLFPLLILSAAIFTTGSRMGLAFMLMLGCCAMGIALWSAFRDGSSAFLRAVCVFLLLGMLSGGGLYFYLQERTPFAVVRIRTLNTTTSLQDRLQLIRVSAAVAQDRLLWGWGAGSFAYVSQPYLKKIPSFVERKHPQKLTRYLAHAHCDWIEFPAEMGLLGCLPLAGIGLYWMGVILRRVRTLPGEVWMMAFGIVALAAHAVFDFPLSAPAVQMMLALLLCASGFLAKASAPAKT